jgi:hypothetical protein
VTKRRRIFVGLEFTDYQQWLSPRHPASGRRAPASRSICAKERTRWC